MKLTHDPEQSYAARWIERLTAAGHEVQIVDVFADDLFEQLHGCDGFLWWFPPVHVPRELGKRLLLALDHAGQLLVAPDHRGAWHYDDKVAQYYLLRAAGIPIPATWVFWRYTQAKAFLATARYPLVLKLSTGFRSQNVILLHDRPEGAYWAQRLFGVGASALRRYRFFDPRPLVRRAHHWMTGGRRPHLESGYLLLQEFLPGNDFDIRVTVIGNRAFAARRGNRANDFRASGSGRNEQDPALIPEDAVRLAFRTAQVLGTTSLAVDILRRDGQPVILEISYYYEAWGVVICPGHFRLTDDDRVEWVAGPMRAEDAILDDFLTRLAERLPA